MDKSWDVEKLVLISVAGREYWHVFWQCRFLQAPQVCSSLLSYGSCLFDTIKESDLAHTPLIFRSSRRTRVSICIKTNLSFSCFFLCAWLLTLTRINSGWIQYSLLSSATVLCEFKCFKCLIPLWLIASGVWLYVRLVVSCVFATFLVQFLWCKISLIAANPLPGGLSERFIVNL